MQAALSDASAMSEISRLLGTSVSDVKSEFVAHFEAMAQKLLDDMDRGPHKLIQNLSFRLLCRTYCGSSAPYDIDTFLLAMGAFLENDLHVDAVDLSEVWSNDAQASVRMALDRDGDGKVSPSITALKTECDRLPSCLALSWFCVALQVSLPEINQLAKRGVEFMEVVGCLVAQGQAAPFLCPPSPTVFLGYEDKLATAMALLQQVPQTSSPAVVCGPPKSGVSSFVTVLAHRARDSGAFPGGIYVISLQGTQSPDAGLAAVCYAVNAAVGNELQASLGVWCRRRKSAAVVMIDCGQQPHSKWMSVFADSFTGSPVRWLVASSAEVTEPDVSTAVMLNGLQSTEYCVELIKASAPHMTVYSDVIQAAARAMPGRIVQLCDLGVEVVAGLAAPSAGTMSDTTGSAAAGWSPHDLAMLTVFPASFTLAAAAAVWNCSESTAQQRLDPLARSNMCSVLPDARWVLSSNIDWSALDVDADGVGGSRVVVARFAKHYVDLLSFALERVEQSDFRSALYIFDTDRDSFNKLLNLACKEAEAAALHQWIALREQLDALSATELRALLLLRFPVEHAKVVSEAFVTMRRGRAKPVALSDALLAHCAVVLSDTTTAATRRELVALAQEAIAIRRQAEEQAPGSLPIGHDTFAALESLAVLKNSLSCTAEAEALLQEVLDGRRAKYGVEHRETALSLNSIAAAKLSQHKFEEALSLLQESARITEAVAPHSATIAVTRSNMGIALMELGRAAEAADMHTAALARYTADLGRVNSEVIEQLDLLGNCYAILSMHDEAWAAVQESVDLRRVLYGPSHLNFAEGIDMLASLLMRQGKPADAVEFLKQALEIRKACLPPNSPQLQANMQGIFMLICQSGDGNAAMAFAKANNMQ